MITGTLFAALAVALGAFGAHGLQKITSDEKLIHGYQTAVQYQFWHALALLLTGILYEKFDTRLMKWATRCFIGGIILFSGSLYLLTCLKSGKRSYKNSRAHYPAGRAAVYYRLVIIAGSLVEEKMI